MSAVSPEMVGGLMKAFDDIERRREGTDIIRSLPAFAAVSRPPQSADPYRSTGIPFSRGDRTAAGTAARRHTGISAQSYRDRRGCKLPSIPKTVEKNTHGPSGHLEQETGFDQTPNL
jgi:hypothetical protein